MNTQQYVANLIATQKAEGKNPQQIAWNAALACVGWPYVFGARGELCNPANRRKYYRDDHPTIKTACKNFDGSGSCSGCKWYPGGERVRCFDCRGFTYWILLQVYDWKLMGTGATKQWNDPANWKAQGEIKDGIPQNTLVCLFVAKGKTMEHTGFGLNDETIECSAGVQHFTKRKAKWTHWGVPACIDGVIPDPTPAPEPTPGWRPTIRRGNKGADVIECQTMLTRLGYDIGKAGIDGDFGRGTEAGVKAFQKDQGLVVDGVVGPMTWDALDKAIAKKDEDPSEKVYSVIIRGLDKTQAEAIANNYPGAEIVEGSDSK